MSVLREIAQKVKELLDDLETLKQEEKIAGLEYPFEEGEEYFVINVIGELVKQKWSNHLIDKKSYKQGNIFKTRKEAEKEQARRELLMLFKQYRDKCNGGWKPNFIDFSQNKYSMWFDYYSRKLEIFTSTSSNDFRLFGYFRKEDDCRRAIELFGDEIKRLFVEEEK